MQAGVAAFLCVYVVISVLIYSVHYVYAALIYLCSVWSYHMERSGALTALSPDISGSPVGENPYSQVPQCFFFISAKVAFFQLFKACFMHPYNLLYICFA